MMGAAFKHIMASLAALLATLCPAGAVGQSNEPTPTSASCPQSVAAVARCYSGQDENGAFYWIAIPNDWNHHLIVHAHGGPRLGEVNADSSIEDLNRFAVMVQRGYAWIGSSYRNGGYGVRMAAADVDHSRALFWRAFGRPELTILHGQSWGGNVAAKTEELYPTGRDGSLNYDGVLLTSGVLAGGTRAYAFRADLRAVYQYYCHNHPSPGEMPYPLWQGLPLGMLMTRAELEERVNACTGVDLPPERRSLQQAERLRSITNVIGIDEQHLVSHLEWATFTFHDLVQRLGGRNPFDNSQTRYVGSSDDAALNAGVQRFTADPEAVAQLAYDSNLSGAIAAPTLTLHALHDPTAAFAMEALYAQTVAAAGRSDLLVQTATDESAHSKLSDAEYVTLLQTLETWIDDQARPGPAAIAARCHAFESTNSGGCHFIVHAQEN